MDKKFLNEVFKPASKPEQKSAATDRAAREAIDRDAAAAATKIERLKAARLARDAELPPVVKKAAKKPAKA